MKKCIGYFAVLAALTLSIGCSKSSTSPTNTTNPDGADLLGLKKNHTLRYVIYDSIVNFIPYYSVQVDTSQLQLTVTTAANSHVALSVDGHPHDLLTLDDLGVLHTGQIRPEAQPPDTLYFYPTPLLMPRTYTAGKAWSILSPSYSSDSGSERLSLLYINYGFLTLRKFIGQADVVLPTGSYQTYQFQSHLLLSEASTDTLMTVDEFYASGVGPVKIISRAAGSRRIIILLDDE
jgi:hypothetical protein